MRRSIRVSDADMLTFQKAAELAEQGQHRVRVAAFLMKGGRPLGASWNRKRNILENVQYGEITYHAEHHVLNTTKANCSGLTLYVARIGTTGDLLPSHPCPRCMRTIEFDGRVSKLVYLDENKNLVKVRI